jgi:hypothetical protein
MKKILVLFLFLFFALPVLVQGCVNINTGTLVQLDELTSIGPAKAQAIIDARPYSSVDDLDRAVGIGPATVQKIKDQGLASVNCATQQNSNQTTTVNNTLNPASITPENPVPLATTTMPISYPSGVYINEILPNPEGPDETDEFIEFYNSNNFEVDLSGWIIKDSVGTITIFTIPQNTKILAYGFLAFKRPQTKIMLNNDEDGLILLSPDNKTVDSVNYSKAPLGQSYSKTSAGFVWSANLTFGTTNIIATPRQETVKQALPNTKKSDNSNGIEAGLADISQSINQDYLKNSNPWFLFFTALVVTIISAIIVLFIKFKFKNHVRT